MVYMSGIRVDLIKQNASEIMKKITKRDNLAVPFVRF